MATNELQVVVFKLAGQSFGVDISRVKEIIVMQRIVRIPRAPQFVEGIINLRGKVIPVIDLLKRFGLDQARDKNNERIVVVEFEDLNVGLIVDAVSEVLHVDRDIIAPPSPIIIGADVEYLEGIAKVDQQLIILLNLERVLSVEESNDITTVMRQVGDTCSTEMPKIT